jgi:hypothetical protein
MRFLMAGVWLSTLLACSARGGGGGVLPMDMDVADGGDETPADTAVPDITSPDTRRPDTAVPDTATPDTAAPDTRPLDTGRPDTGRPDTAVEDTFSPDGDGVCPASCITNTDCDRCWRAGETRLGSYCCAANLCIYRPEMTCTAATDSGVPTTDLPDVGDIAGGS